MISKVSSSPSIKKKNPLETRTTLDTLHTNQIKQIKKNENELEKLIDEKIEINRTLLSITDDIEYDQLEHKLKYLENEIKSRNNKNEYLDYFLDTGEILYKYYDLQEKIQEGKVTSTTPNRKKIGSIFDALDKVSKDNNEEEVKHTKLKEVISRDKLLEEYLKVKYPDIVKSSNTIIEDTFGECPECEKEMVFSSNEALLTCTECGFQESILIDSDKPSYKDPPREVSYYAYKRINHFNEWLAQFQAKESTDIPSEVLDSILIELKKERIIDTNNIKQTKVREILKKLKLNKYYEHVPHIINKLNGQYAPLMSREIEEKLRFMFKEIQPSFVKHCPPERNNFLSYSYVLYKFCELLNLDEYLHCFPLLKNRDKLYNQDKIWQKICEDLKWEYIRSL